MYILACMCTRAYFLVTLLSCILHFITESVLCSPAALLGQCWWDLRWKDLLSLLYTATVCVVLTCCTVCSADGTWGGRICWACCIQLQSVLCSPAALLGQCWWDLRWKDLLSLLYTATVCVVLTCCTVWGSADGTWGGRICWACCIQLLLCFDCILFGFERETCAPGWACGISRRTLPTAFVRPSRKTCENGSLQQ
jgi:hypothetical protein